MKHLFLLFGLIIASVNFAQVDLLIENFDTGIPATFTIVDNSNQTPHPDVAEYTEAWITVEYPASSGNFVASSTSYFENSVVSEHWLITPALTLGAYGNFMQWQGRCQDASYPDGYFVMISTTDTQLSSFTDTLEIVSFEFADTWTQRMIDLSAAGYDNQTVYLAFSHQTLDGYKLYLDSLHIWMEDPVSLNELTYQEANVYPNPTTDALSFSSADEVWIYSSTGQLLDHIENASTIDVSMYATGIYMIQLKQGNAIARSRWVKID